MKTNVARKLSSIPTSNNESSTSDAIELISNRQSKELVIGFCGPIGAGIENVRKSFEKNLNDLGYETKHIHISSLMNQFDELNRVSIRGYERYIQKQDKGDHLRQKFSPQILAEAAITEMTLFKEEKKKESGISENDKFTGKVAYLIDQLKHPSEVELLRLANSNNFYLVGVLRSEHERKRCLRDEGIMPKEVDDLIHRDRKSSLDEGQQTEKAILDADFFVRNNQSHVSDLNIKAKRFIDLIHGKNGITPSIHEKGMYSAYSASLQSACLSRQVGASIVDSFGRVIATGCNDVPKAGGGLYSFEDDRQDYRCIHKGAQCYNDAHKDKIKKKMSELLNSELGSYIDSNINPDSERSEEMKKLVQNLKKSEFADDLTKQIFDNSPLRDLIEYSRAIHAEMDAIVSLARTGSSSTSEKTLFTTTYPCHNCARHIVAAGISTVFYIEPYEKSLALDLHDDAISDTEKDSDEVVNFIQFDGVSPRRYQKFFL